MCEKAVEVRKLWKNVFDVGDFYYCDGEVNTVSCGQIRQRQLVWLPRQDQLQGMVYAKSQYKPINAILLEKFHIFACSSSPTPNRMMSYYFDSMEQLWLAFVMKEKFNKTWEGTQWTEERQTRLLK